MTFDTHMAFPGQLSDLEREWSECRSMEIRRNTMVDALFDTISKINKENEQLKNKVEMYEYSGVELLEIKRRLIAENSQLRDRLISSPFVLVLIDGDATQFNDIFVQAGTAGGHKAAHGLKQALEQFIANKLGLPPTIKTVIRVYFNAIGLKAAYVSAGIVDEGRIIWDFVLGFNRELQLAEFVDAGQDKEAADHKIKANLDLFWRDENCRHILLACSADQGYVSHLRQYSNKREDRDRLTLIESKPFPAAFKELAASFGEAQNFKELFRSTHLVTQSRGPPVRPPGWISGVQENVPPLTAPAVELSTSPAPALAPRLRPIPLNKKGQRVNRVLMQYDGTLLADMQARNLCPQFHLTRCSNTARNCDYDHTPVELTVGEKRLLARVARTMVCPKGFTCRDRDCVKGHHCLYDETCHFKDTCKFSEAQHFVDKNIVKEV